jgi:hypothetical protein
MNRIIRSICLFTEKASEFDYRKLLEIEAILSRAGFEIQTRRIVTHADTISNLGKLEEQPGLFYAAGTLSRSSLWEQLEDFLKASSVSCNLEIHDHVELRDVDFLFELIRQRPEKTFQFSYTFSNPHSTPFFPAARFEREGFSLGLQSTDLAAGCEDLHSWLHLKKGVWDELVQLFKERPDFLGIDSSVAPLFSGDSSFIHLAERLCGSFSNACTSDFFVQVSRFIKQNNPKPVGLCGLMFPCLEDFVLAEAYEKGEFNIERNIFLSLHSGTGIDTWPIGIDEDPKRIQQILNLLLALAKKYNKPLSARFISDGKVRIGEKSDFRNPYLKDVVIRKV